MATVEMKSGENLEEFLSPILNKIPNPDNKKATLELIARILKTYPQLKLRIAWNQPMFTDHGTFILGMSFAKAHFSISPEYKGMVEFAPKLDKLGMDYSKMLIRIPWAGEVPFALIQEIIEFNMKDKAEVTTFWRHDKRDDDC
ncbi:uncharacterized protein YdhG (YjbR/CyaY superfamily) [Arcanobacterium pluranimalium]|uniref:iron chaperone n=1 Tax=Arcanobacterium pluranimalium TaxID=108028 RepID=UPI00195661C9|nr:DUF1801 domain-containing protein [Arcanobacterium pluranimalium]MBM7825695.1 uncharacterized protein YdhG (YjbR/CyaY superfamily) [Arcanobacterium pluranimalium]